MMTPVVEVLLLTRRRPAGMAPSPKRRFPRPRRSGENPQVAAIDQPVLDQGLEQIGAAVHLELGAVLLLEAPDLRDNVALFPSSPNEQWEDHADGQEDPLWPAGARRSQAIRGAAPLVRGRQRDRPGAGRRCMVLRACVSSTERGA